MDIDIKFRGVAASEELRGHAQRQLHFHLSRFGHDVRSVVMRLDDDNGPRGGTDKRCSVTLRGDRIGTLVLVERHESTLAAIDGAARRLSRLVGRSLSRARDREEGGAHAA
jgi:putative sigma-54 modulation protein